MPIEIKELYIKINVNDSDQSNAAPNKEPGADQDAIIKLCLEQTFESLKRKKER